MHLIMAQNLGSYSFSKFLLCNSSQLQMPLIQVLGMKTWENILLKYNIDTDQGTSNNQYPQKPSSCSHLESDHLHRNGSHYPYF